MNNFYQINYSYTDHEFGEKVVMGNDENNAQDRALKIIAKEAEKYQSEFEKNYPGEWSRVANIGQSIEINSMKKLKSRVYSIRIFASGSSCIDDSVEILEISESRAINKAILKIFDNNQLSFSSDRSDGEGRSYGVIGVNGRDCFNVYHKNIIIDVAAKEAAY